mmetsp:Transcript_24159/g.33877  ORF Transcript_24159/g.33877 Transcript_24159/m.33877 type:complete len:325 (+) Transcript_24159:35-1009(+)
MATQVQQTEPQPETPTQVPKKSANPFKGIIKTTKNVARKLGKGGNAQEGEEPLVISRMQYLDSLAESVPKVTKVFKRESELLKELTDQQKTLLIQTTDFHQQILKDKTENESASANFVENVQLSFCQLHTELASLETSLIESISETGSPIAALSNVAVAKEQYKKWQAAGQAAESANKKLENAKKDKNAQEAKIKELETELANAKTAFEAVDRETLTAIEAAIERIELEYWNRVKNNYVDAYRTYFKQGQDLLKKVQSQIAKTATPPPEIEDLNAGSNASGGSTTPSFQRKAVQKRGGSNLYKVGAVLALAAVAFAGYYFKMRK